MKKFLPICLMAALLISSVFNVKAGTWRVGYYGTATSIDYQDLQTAVNNVNRGDTIYLYPGNWNANISQKVTIIGYGYFLNKSTANASTNNSNGIPNTGLQVITPDMSVSINLFNGSDSSAFEGLEGASIGNSDGQGNFFYPNAIILDRFDGAIYFYGQNGQAIDGWVITRSFTALFSPGNNYYANSAATVTNLTVNNSYLSNCDFTNSSNGLQQSGSFSNDVFATANIVHFNSGNFIVQNSIFMDTADGDASVGYYNNLYNTDAGSWTTAGNGNGSGNIAASFSAKQVFVDYPTGNQGVTPANKYSPDAGLALATGSPAKGKGAGGTDMGIYGGTTPYLLSGIPPVPTFYKLTAGSVDATANPYTVTFSVRSNN